MPARLGLTCSCATGLEGPEVEVEMGDGAEVVVEVVPGGARTSRGSWGEGEGEGGPVSDVSVVRVPAGLAGMLAGLGLGGVGLEAVLGAGAPTSCHRLQPLRNLHRGPISGTSSMMTSSLKERSASRSTSCSKMQPRRKNEC